LKQSLEKAQGSFVNFKAAIMKQRMDMHEYKMQEFIAKKGIELQTKILDDAKAELRKTENLRKVKEAEEKRRKTLEEKERKEKAEGRFTAGGDDDASGWNKGSAKQPVVETKSDF
jgi:hypothetical protein